MFFFGGKGRGGTPHMHGHNVCMCVYVCYVWVPMYVCVPARACAHARD